MDVNEFMKEFHRMCEFYGDGCNKGDDECPMRRTPRTCKDVRNFTDDIIGKIVDWSATHHKKTNREALQEKFGSVVFSADGFFTLKNFQINGMSVEEWLNQTYVEPEEK